MPVAIFATITPRPEHLDHARAAIRDILAPTRAEPGCMTFELHDAAEGETLHLYEVWADHAALEAHHAQPYTKTVFRHYADWLAVPVELRFLQPVA